ncbi:hypothetical protein [Thalassospira sp. CH_XMU1420-2]|uniref:hypothetical protein n=1 Tax=Thalassospira sp. CH_XMU1420-2 TaxID=3107769 RepID=UPI00300B830E
MQDNLANICHSFFNPTTVSQIMTDNAKSDEDPALWEDDLANYPMRDVDTLGPFVLVTVQKDDGSRHVVEGYFDGEDWWLSGMSKSDYHSAPMEDCVGLPIAYRELPPPFGGPVKQPSADPTVIQFPLVSRRRN